MKLGDGVIATALIADEINPGTIGKITRVNADRTYDVTFLGRYPVYGTTIFNVDPTKLQPLGVNPPKKEGTL